MVVLSGGTVLKIPLKVPPNDVIGTTMLSLVPPCCRQKYHHALRYHTSIIACNGTLRIIIVCPEHIQRAVICSLLSNDQTAIDLTVYRERERVQLIVR